VSVFAARSGVRVGDESLEVTFRGAQDTSSPGEVVDIAGEGITLRFPADWSRRFPPGHAGVLTFHTGSLGTICSLAAEITSRGPDGGEVRIGFCFLEHPPYLEGMPRELQSAFNRRASFRVRPRGDAPISLIFTPLVGPGGVAGGGPDFELVGAIMDISLHGVSGTFKDTAPRPGDSLPRRGLARFHLPDTEGPIVSEVTLRHVVQEGDVLHLGMQFWGGGPTSRQAMRRLQAYIMDRQREALRRRIAR